MENPEFIRAVGGTASRCSSPPAACPRRRCARRWSSPGACPVGLLHGFQTFPTPIEEIRFRELAAWKERYRVPVGFLDHTDGGSAFALVAPALAVSYGADLVEKHFTLDRSEKGFDYQSSLNPEDFYRMVELLRQAERARGRRRRPRDSDGAKRYHRLMARSIVAGALIPRGEVLTARDAGLQAHRRALRARLPAARVRTASSAAAPRGPSRPTRRSARTCSSERCGPCGSCVVGARMASSRCPGKALAPWPAGRCSRCCSSACAPRAASSGVALATSRERRERPARPTSRAGRGSGLPRATRTTCSAATWTARAPWAPTTSCA